MKKEYFFLLSVARTVDYVLVALIWIILKSGFA